MPDTVRVDISYRPVRVGWAVRSDDLAGIRKAVRYSHALCGGRFNPIIAVDREDEARQLVELFRLDVIQPVGDSPEVNNFPKKFRHLIRPFHSNSVFVRQTESRSFSWMLDIQNTVAHWQHRPEWKHLRESGVRAYDWHPDDPLADVLLMQLGGLPDPEDVGVDYVDLVARNLEPTAFALALGATTPADIVDHPGVNALSRFGLERDYVIRPGWDMPGFFVGSTADADDLRAFWNIRACDIPLWFVDPDHIERYAELIPAWTRVLQTSITHSRHEWDRHIGVWSRRDVNVAARLFSITNLTLCGISDFFWGGGAVKAPVMHLGRTSTLGVVSGTDGVPRVNFALADKPFNSDAYFAQQHLVASVSFVGGLYGDEQYTFDVPWIPELNEFYARTMHYKYDKLRIEPERTGIIVDAADHDTFLTAMPIAALFKKVFSLAGLESSLSNSGRVVRQLLAQLGGLQGARVFKIPGARSLLKQFGIAKTFTRDVALNVIRDKSSEHPTGTFSDHTDLLLETRSRGELLTPPHVFTFMVDKGLFRIGAELHCLHCDMKSWVSLDTLSQNVTCDFCGHSYDATRQLVDITWRFRRSGILGAERNAQGAIPVALTLQQLDTTFHRWMSKGTYSPSIDVTPMNGVELPVCEIDFAWLQPEPHSGKTCLILAECKDQGSIKPEEFQQDISNLRRIADAFPKDRFNTYILFAKLAPFTIQEIATARTLNDRFCQRVILLTDQELEPYFMLERREKELGKYAHAASPRELANVTAQLYFPDPPG